MKNQGALIAGDQVAIKSGTTLTTEGMIFRRHMAPLLFSRLR